MHTFTEVLPMLKAGHAVRRSGWKPESNIRLDANQKHFVWETGNPVNKHGNIISGLFTNDWEVAELNK